MIQLRFILIALCLCISFYGYSDEIDVQYELMDRNAFQEIVVGNTIVGISLNSHSLYMLYFLPDGYCELWKQNQIYEGKWWIETDALGRDFVRAFWPTYISSKPQSLFSPENPRYGNATSVRYYRNPKSGTIMLAGKNFQASALLVPGCPFAR